MKTIFKDCYSQLAEMLLFLHYDIHGLDGDMRLILSSRRDVSKALFVSILTDDVNFRTGFIAGAL